MGTLQDQQIHRLLEENRSLKDELVDVKAQLADAKSLLEAQRKELKGAQVFLTKADTLSTTDVVQKVNALNEEIFQAAALLGEMLKNTERTGRTQEQITEAFEKARWMLGEHLATILAAESLNLRTDLNPLLVQVVFQIAITTWCKFVVCSWKPSDATVADFLAAIYSEIRQVEDQAVSGRWRSITRAQLRSSSDDWTENLMSGILSILVIAGWSTREPDQQHQFVRRLPPIFKAVQDLRKALGEDVTSMDMEVTIIDPGQAFNPTYMEDEYEEVRASSGNGKKIPERVRGTTGLGLHKISTKRTPKGVPHSEMLLSPRVILEGTVKEAMDPAPPPASRLRRKPKRDIRKSASADDIESLSGVEDKELNGDADALSSSDTYGIQKQDGEEGWEISGESDILLTADAIQMVDVLNVEVRRVAAVLSKVLQKTEFEGGHRQIIQITEKARSMLGENMVALLSAGLPERARVNPVLVQVVLQVAITNWCKSAISSWKPGNSDVSNVLVELYSKIREVEDPTFYRRWRSVTWAQLEFSSSGWSQDLLDGLLDVFAFARWPTPNADQKKLFEEQFPPIFNAIRDLRKALGEDITSIDIEVATVDPGTTFDSALMDNGWPALRKENTSEIVSGTTGLGLKEVMAPSTGGLSLAPNADVICRPKVILERTVQEAWVVTPSLRAQKKGVLKRGSASGDGRG